MIRFSTDYNIFLVTFVRLLKTEEVCACCYFCHMIDLTEHFTVKHQKLLLQYVRFGAWVLKNPLIAKDHQ